MEGNKLYLGSRISWITLEITQNTLATDEQCAKHTSNRIAGNHKLCCYVFCPVF